MNKEEWKSELWKMYGEGLTWDEVRDRSRLMWETDFALLGLEIDPSAIRQVDEIIERAKAR